MFARGIGKYWFDEEGLKFLRTLTSKPISLPFSIMSDVEIGKWHSGRWGQGYNIVKILWTKNNKMLCSGFILSKDNGKILDIVSNLKNEIKKKI
jgi:hypothetical protein